MTETKLIELDVDRLAGCGDGVGRYNGKVVFVEGAYAGDQVLARLIKEKKRHAEAVAVKILKPSTDRRKPICPVASDCGGCPWMGLDYKTQLIWKQTIIIDSLARIGKIETTVLKVSGCDPEYGYRMRVRLRVVRGEPPRLGYSRRRSNNLVGIERCPIANDLVNIIIGELNQYLEKNREEIKGIDEISIETGVETTGRIIVHGKIKFEASLARDMLKNLDSVGEVILQGGREELSFGSAAITAEGQDGISYTLSPGSFSQINQYQNLRLIETVANAAEPSPGAKILDLYCGAGAYTIPLAKAGAALTGVDKLRQNIDDARANAAKASAITAAFLVDDAEETVKKMLKNKEAFETVIANPPRAGMHSVAGDVGALAKKRIVYISCDPASLARDAAVLSKNQFRLVKIAPIDLFPQTPHVESVAVFEKS